MAKTYLEKAVKIIEWEHGTDFKGQLEYMAKCCGWDAIAIYASAQLERAADGLESSHQTPSLARALDRDNSSPSSARR